MPDITPNLLLIDANVAAQECVSTLLANFAGNLLVASDCDVAAHILSEHLIDLIVFDPSVIDCHQQTDAAIARFHQLKGQHDVPVIFICGSQRTGVSLKTHPWGVAYHVQQSIDPNVLSGLIHASLSLPVSYGASPPQASDPAEVIPKPHGLPLPEVIMPSEMMGVSDRAIPS